MNEKNESVSNKSAISHEDLIDQLSKDLTPRRVRPSESVLWLRWFVLSFVLVVMVLAFLRPINVQQMMRTIDVEFLFEFVLSILAILSTARLAFMMSTPGKVSGSYKQVFYAIMPLIAYVFFLGYRFFKGGDVVEVVGMSKRPHCVYEVLALSWIPIVVMVWQLRKSYPFFVGRIGLLMGVAGAAIPMTLMQFICSFGAKHVFTFHLVPALIIALIAAVLSRLILRVMR